MIHSTFCIQKTKFHLIAERLPQRSATLFVAEKVPLVKKIVSENVYPQSYYIGLNLYPQIFEIWEVNYLSEILNK